jgi:drug/metabolite transporter (DMT)-like permease
MSRSHANALILLAALFWGSGNVAQQTILRDVGPFMASALRCAIAALVILPFVCRGGNHRLPAQASTISLLVLTVMSFSTAIVAGQIGIGMTSVTNAGFLWNTSVVVAPFVMWLLFKQKPEAKVWPLAMLTLTGAFLMGGGTIRSLNTGDMLCIASAVFYSIWMVLLGELVKRSSSCVLVTFMQFAFATFICIGISALSESNSSAAIQAALPQAAYLGIVSTAIPFLLQGFAQSRTSASEAAILVSAEAIFGAAAAYLLLSESISPIAMLGAGLIAVGIVTVQLPSSKQFSFALSKTI